MRAYGLIDEAANLTDFGHALYDLRADAALYDKLAAHILLNLHGMALVRCIQEMTIAGERVTLDALRHVCGFHDTWTLVPRSLGQAVGAQRRRFALLV